MRKKIMVSIGYAVFLFAAVSCNGPCDKAVDRTLKCTKNAMVRDAIKEHRDKAVKLCSPFEDKVKKCLDEPSCPTFLECMDRATARLRMEVGGSRRARPRGQNTRSTGDATEGTAPAGREGATGIMTPTPVTPMSRP